MKKLPILLAALFVSVSAVAQDGHYIGEIPSEEGLFPFMISYDLAKDGVTDCSYLLDAPAGKHGFTRIEGQHFVNDAGPIRFNGVNIVGGANFPSKEQAERMAKRLAHLGFNMVRLHFFDLSDYNFRDIYEKGILVNDGTFLTFDPERQDKFDYMIFQFKKHGIYINVNLMVGRPFKGRNGFDKDIQQKEIDYARKLFTHVNPYTGLTLADEPAVALVELNNENAVFASMYRAQTSLNPDWPTYDELRKSSDERRMEVLAMYEKADRDHWNRQRDVLVNELGVKVPVAGTQADYTTLWASEGMDYFDKHAYWCHPSNQRDRNNWAIRNVPMVNDTLGGTLTALATYRPSDRPYTVSEYNHPFPNLYGAEGQPMLHAYGAFQDWDGLIGHAYHNRQDVEPDNLAYHFTYASRTDALAHSIACATMFLRKDVDESKDQYVQHFPRKVFEDQWKKRLTHKISDMMHLASDYTFSRRHRLVHRVAVDMYAKEGKAFPKEDLGNVVYSDGGQIEWNLDIPDRGMFIVRTDNTKVFSGFPAGRTVDWGDGISFEVGPTKLGWTTMSLVSRKGNGFEKGSESLLVVTGYTRHTDQKLTADPDPKDPSKPSVMVHCRNENWGRGPMLTEGVPVKVKLNSKASRTKCWALDESGRRCRSIPVSKADDGSAILEVGPEYRTIWYEINVR